MQNHFNTYSRRDAACGVSPNRLENSISYDFVISSAAEPPDYGRFGGVENLP